MSAAKKCVHFVYQTLSRLLFELVRIDEFVKKFGALN